MKTHGPKGVFPKHLLTRERPRAVVFRDRRREALGEWDIACVRCGDTGVRADGDDCNCKGEQP